MRDAGCELRDSDTWKGCPRLESFSHQLLESEESRDESGNGGQRAQGKVGRASEALRAHGGALGEIVALGPVVYSRVPKKKELVKARRGEAAGGGGGRSQKESQR